MFDTIRRLYMNNNQVYKVRPGHFLDKQRYYIIRRKPLGAGFFSNYFYVLYHMMYAREKGYYPVVDMKNYRTLYSEDHPVNETENAWEYYFQQPECKTLEEAYCSGNYILSSYGYKKNYSPYSPYSEIIDDFIIDKEKLNQIYTAVQDMIILNPVLQRKIDEVKRDKFKRKNILGIHYRGTDKHKKHEGHYISPDVQQFLDAAYRIVDENKVDGIFLCTDEMDVINIFDKEFSGLVFWNDAYRAEAGNNQGIHLEKKEVRENHKYQLGVEVIMDAYLLAECQYMIHAHSNVTNASVVLCNDSFKKRVFIRLKV